VTLPARIGRYEVELLLGEGGWGRVFLARDPMLRRQVAIKVLRDDLGPPRERGKALAERVREEARAAATLSHPGLVALHDMGDDEQVGLYLVFELVRGPTLRERLHEGPLGAEEVGRIAVALAAALTHAHAAGLVHRTVKPENVMIAPTGPKLTDFGLGVQDSRPPAYVAPEVLASAGSGALSDEFALAATMYEALTGRRAFPGEDSGAVAALVETGKHAPPRSVHPALRGYLGLDAVFARAFSPLPSKRFPSCEAFAAGLAGALQVPGDAGAGAFEHRAGDPPLAESNRACRCGRDSYPGRSRPFAPNGRRRKRVGEETGRRQVHDFDAPRRAAATSRGVSLRFHFCLAFCYELGSRARIPAFLRRPDTSPKRSAGRQTGPSARRPLAAHLRGELDCRTPRCPTIPRP